MGKTMGKVTKPEQKLINSMSDGGWVFRHWKSFRHEPEKSAVAGGWITSGGLTPDRWRNIMSKADDDNIIILRPLPAAAPAPEPEPEPQRIGLVIDIEESLREAVYLTEILVDALTNRHSIASRGACELMAQLINDRTHDMRNQWQRAAGLTHPKAGG